MKIESLCSEFYFNIGAKLTFWNRKKKEEEVFFFHELYKNCKETFYYETGL